MKKITKRRIAAPFLSVTPLLVEVAFMFLFALVVAVIDSSLPLRQDGSYENEYLTLGMEFFCSGIAVIFSCAIVKKVTNVRFGEALKFKNFDFSVPIMLTLFAFAAGELSDHLTGLILSNFMTVEPNRGMEFGLYGVISAVIIAPVSEEIMFRFVGCELGRGAYRVPIICIANALFFAACHGYNIQGFLNVFIGGVCAAYVYCKTRNILYTMLEHALHNAICFLPGDHVYYLRNGFVLNNWWYLLINGVIFALCIVWYIKVFRKRYTENYFAVGIPEGDENLPDRIKQAKSFSKVCRNMHIFAFAAEILYGLAVLAVLLGALGAPFIEFKGLISRWELLPEIIWDASLLIVFNFMRLIFGRLKKTDTPFSEGVDQKFKAIAYTLVIGGGVHFFTSLIVSGYISMSVPFEEMNISYSDGLYMLMIGAVIWGLAYVFERGCVLQQESDETL